MRDEAALMEALKLGADPNRAYTDVGGGLEGLTPLGHAIASAHAGLVELLLFPGEDIKAADANQAIPAPVPILPDTEMPPLALASIVGNHSVVRKLLEHGADLEAGSAGRLGRTPLMWAAVRGHSGVVQILLDSGAEIDASLEFPHPDSGEPVGNTALMYAAMAPDRFALRILLDRGADATKVNGGGASALYFALFSGWGLTDRQRLSWLIEAGAPVNARARWADGRTPLMEAVRGGGAVEDRIATAQLLLEAGADPMAMDDHGNTLLHFVTFFDEWGDAEHIVRFLIDLGLDPNAQNDQGETALHIIAGRPYLGTEALRLLLEADADPRIKDHRGETPLDRVRELKGHIRQAEAHLHLLEEHAERLDHERR